MDLTISGVFLLYLRHEQIEINWRIIDWEDSNDERNSSSHESLYKDR
jgi:hypothetical protein